MRKLNFLPLLLVLLSACSALGVPKAETFNQRALAAYTTVTAARDTSTTLFKAGKLSRDDFGNVIKQCDNAREGIDVARTLWAAKPTDGEDRLALAITILTALNTYLAEKQQ